MKNQISQIALGICFFFMLGVHFFGYPKWQKQWTEATLSWDVSGYYFYLPAIFIYKDLKKCAFYKTIQDKYRPSASFYQAFPYKNGNYVMKYPCGQAIQYLPFFAIAHVYALNSTTYPADGFSQPYQFMISLGSLLIAFIGLLYLKKILRLYFSDIVTAIVLLSLVVGTNYLEYTAITGAMPHNYLFTLYALLIYQTIRFYEKPTYWRTALIGGFIGLMALTRPTEVIAAIIPILWGLSIFSRAAITQRLNFFKTHFLKLGLAILIVGSLGCIQLIYWKYVSGDWVVYSYQEQGFDWFSPHIQRGFLGFNNGWLVYTPLMVFALIGFVPLYQKHRSVFYAIFPFFLLFSYIAFAWSIWWYAGSLGQRTMVQIYPLLAFPLAAFVAMILKSRWVKYLVLGIGLVFCYHNLWVTYQAHLGGLYFAGEMTRAYFWKVVGRFEVEEESLKLLDTNEEFTGQRKQVKILYTQNFEMDSLPNCEIEPIEGQKSLCVSSNHSWSPVFDVAFDGTKANWIRATADFRCLHKEWDTWKMTQFILRFYNDETIVKSRFIRVYRALSDGQTKTFFIDVSCPKKPFNRVGVAFWNVDSVHPIAIDNLKIESFRE